jgi:ubiquinone/menaquinone biosynthesis C-methylase UbiE/glycosyltransferase involved in cell wall biosynthesis
MRVLIDCVPLTVGGGVQVATGVLAGLARQPAIDWTAVMPRALRPALPEALAADPRIVFVNRCSQADRVWLTPRLHRLERAVAPDVVFTVFGPPFFRPRAPHLVGFALPHLIYDRDSGMPRKSLADEIGDAARRMLFRRANHIVVETETARQRLAHWLGIDRARISVIPNSPNPLLERLPEPPARADGPFNILIPSAYYWHKNLEIVPQVAAAMRRLSPGLDFRFHVTLAPDSAPWQRIAIAATELGVADRLTTLGVVRIEALSRAYHEAAVVYLPTLREVSTAVYPESFFFRRPLVTSDMDFAHELCGDAALFVPPRDAEATAWRLVELAASPEMRACLVAAGERRLVSAYPTSEEKFKLQLELITKLARGQKLNICSGADIKTGAVDANVATDTAKDPAISFHDRIGSDWDSKYASGGFARRASFFTANIMPEIIGTEHWLDAGCGSGYFSRLLADHGHTVTGVDGSSVMISMARRLAAETGHSNAIRFDVVETVERLPFDDASFDNCLCLSVIEYLKRPDDCLSELARVIVPGGTLALSMPYRNAPVRLAQKCLVSLRNYRAPRNWQYIRLSSHATTPAELGRWLGTHGFALRKTAGFDAVLPSALWNLVRPSLLFAVATRQATDAVPCGAYQISPESNGCREINHSVVRSEKTP